MSDTDDYSKRSEQDVFGYKAQGRIKSAQTKCCSVMLFIAAINIALAVVQAELRWHLRSLSHVENMCNIIKGINSLFIGVMLVALIVYYRLELEYLVVRNVLPSGASIWNSGLLPKFLLEFAILGIHAPPWFLNAPSKTSDIRPLVGFQGEAILTTCVFLRVYLIWRWICARSRLFSPSGRFIEVLTKSEFDAALVAKLTINRYPVRSVSIVFALLLAVTSYTVWCLERWNAIRQTFIDPDGNYWQTNIGHELIWFGNCIWLTFVTVFTIGYGDLYPVTPAGRVVILVSGFVGNMCNALLIAIMTGLVNLTPTEEKVQHFLARDRYRRRVKNCAVECVQTAYRAWRTATRDARLRREARRKEDEALRPLSQTDGAAGEEARRRGEGYERDASCADAVQTGCADAVLGRRPRQPRPPGELDFKLHRNLIKWRKLKRQGAHLARDEIEDRHKQEAEVVVLRRSLDAIIDRLDALTAKVDAIGTGDPAAVASAMAALSAATGAGAGGRRRSLVPRRRSSTYMPEGTPTMRGVIAGVASRSPSPGAVGAQHVRRRVPHSAGDLESLARHALSPGSPPLQAAPPAGAAAGFELTVDPGTPHAARSYSAPSDESSRGQGGGPAAPTRAASVGGPGRPLL